MKNVFLLAALAVLTAFDTVASERISALVTLTNVPGDGSNLTVNAVSRTWKTTVTDSTTQILIGTNLANTATNLFNHLAANPFSGVILQRVSTNAIRLTAQVDGALDVLTNNYSTVTLSTQTVVAATSVRVPITAEPSTSARTSIASGLVEALSLATNSIPSNSPALRAAMPASLTLTNWGKLATNVMASTGLVFSVSNKMQTLKQPASTVLSNWSSVPVFTFSNRFVSVQNPNIQAPMGAEWYSYGTNLIWNAALWQSDGDTYPYFNNSISYKGDMTLEIGAAYEVRLRVALGYSEANGSQTNNYVTIGGQTINCWTVNPDSSTSFTNRFLATATNGLVVYTTPDLTDSAALATLQMCEVYKVTTNKIFTAKTNVFELVAPATNVVLSMPQYIDLISSGQNLAPGGSAPTSKPVTNSDVQLYGYDVGNYSFCSMQMPHNIAATNALYTNLVISPHVHWTTFTNIGVLSNVAFRISWRYTPINGGVAQYGTNTVQVGSVGVSTNLGYHHVTELCQITNNSAAISDDLSIRFDRVAASSNSLPQSVGVMFIDTHVPVGNKTILGSRQEYTQ